MYMYNKCSFTEPFNHTFQASTGTIRRLDMNLAQTTLLPLPMTTSWLPSGTHLLSRFTTGKAHTLPLQNTTHLDFLSRTEFMVGVWAMAEWFIWQSGRVNLRIYRHCFQSQYEKDSTVSNLSQCSLPEDIRAMLMCT